MRTPIAEARELVAYTDAVALAIHANGSWCEYPKEGGRAEGCNGDCRDIAAIAGDEFAGWQEAKR